MARGLHNELKTALSADVVKPFFLVDLNFTSPIYIWSGFADLAHGGNTYTGVGDLLALEIAEENQEIGAVGVNITLSGLTGTDILANALQQEYQGKTVSVKLGAFKDDGTIAQNPTVVFSGFMDVMTINEGAEFSTINLSVENKLIRLETANERRYTNEDQKIEHPTDQGFRFVSDIQDKEITWGR